MFITTKAEFIWDSSLSKYVEVSNDGYEYNGEVAQCHGDHSTNTDIGDSNPYDPNYDFPQFSYWQTAHASLHDTTGWPEPQQDFDELSLMDFTTMTGEEIMLALGYDPTDVEKYGEFIPEYEGWRENIAMEEFNITEGIYDVQAGQLGNKARGLAEDYATKTATTGMEMESTLGQGEQSLYNLYEQGEQVTSGGLGVRGGLSKRSRKGIVGQTSSALEQLGGKQRGITNTYETGIRDIQAESDILGGKRELNALDYSAEMADIYSGQKDDVWAYLTNLLLTYDVNPNE